MTMTLSAAAGTGPVWSSSARARGDVVATVKACTESSVAWVARGAGTGLSGGALPSADGVLIVLARLRRMLSVDLDDGIVVVEPGVTNLEITRWSATDGLFYPPDPSSQIVCTIGGNVAENAGGAHCFKYGFTTHYVVGHRARPQPTATS